MIINMQIEAAKLSAEEVAVLLLMCTDRTAEQQLKHDIERTGLFKCAVTEIGSSLELARKKMVSAVMGASLDNGIINKTPHHVHALVHATEEAIQGILSSNTLTGDLGVKISVVRDSQWIAVAVFGHCSAHYMSSHKHIGLGLMHIHY
ncbi:MAG: HutP family protein [Clostridia bacterium]|nr:HutP family protein [Clostridia bacterium]